jgi:hypothetical protein
MNDDKRQLVDLDNDVLILSKDECKKIMDFLSKRSTQMTDDTYNGYANWETWNVKLYIDNEQGSYEHWHDIGRDLLRRTTEDRARRELVELLKQARDEGMLASDGVSWHRVDFHEIADEILEHAQELIDHAS